MAADPKAKEKAQRRVANRARQMTLAPMKVCDHDRLSECKTNGGGVVAYQCTACLATVKALGVCDECKTERWLIKVSVGKRFCSDECVAAERDRRMGRDPKPSSRVAQGPARRLSR